MGGSFDTAGKVAGTGGSVKGLANAAGTAVDQDRTICKGHDIYPARASKLAISQLAEVGCGDAEIQAVTGQLTQVVASCRSKADKKRLSKQAQMRRCQNGNRT
ncbi:hypothetical protein CVM50_20990 [Pseudooceanicola marinus]|nr:hypothetical protein CVM50_20990 [Pseudooceanicola marinus]